MVVGQLPISSGSFRDCLGTCRVLYTNIMRNQLEKDFAYYLDHQDEMVEKYDGKYVVIRYGQVLGAYDDELTAISETQKSHELGTFLVQKVSRGSGGYSQTFHSRVVFS